MFESKVSDQIINFDKQFNQCLYLCFRDFKCKDTIFSLYDLVGGDLEIKPTGNTSYPGFPNRNMDCVLHAVGKPVFHNHIELTYGAWMKDSNSKSDSEKVWLTKDGDYSALYEYNTKASYRKNQPTKVYRLPHQFKVKQIES